jgi:ABC-type Zn uptake system ZnuABC Zn-binding protein ZnuA
MKRLIFALLLCLTLTGCATFATDPETGERVVVRTVDENIADGLEAGSIVAAVTPWGAAASPILLGLAALFRRKAAKERDDKEAERENTEKIVQSVDAALAHLDPEKRAKIKQVLKDLQDLNARRRVAEIKAGA